VDIQSGNISMKYILAQRNDIIYDINGPDHFPANKFLSFEPNYNLGLYKFLIENDSD